MSFQISPGVQVKEQDLSLIIPAVPISIGAIVGNFTWGPVNEIRLVDETDRLQRVFGGPNDENAKDWFSAYNYLQYSKDLRAVRVRPAIQSGEDGSTIANATDIGNSQLQGGQEYFDAITRFNSEGDEYISGQLGHTPYNKIVVDNAGDFINYEPLLENVYIDVPAEGAEPAYKQFLRVLAKYPGSTGTGISVEFCNESGFDTWDYRNQFPLNPIGDQFCVLVRVDGQIVETFFVSANKDETDRDGRTMYAPLVLNEQSEYINVLMGNLVRTSTDAPVQFVTRGPVEAGEEVLGDNLSLSLLEGEDVAYATGEDLQSLAAAKMLGWDLFEAATEIDINFCILGGTADMGPAGISVIRHVVQNVCEVRMDCVAFISPPQHTVVNQANPAQKVSDWFKDFLQINSSYAVADGNYKLQLDPFNRVFRWLPLNGDIAGLAARTAYNRDPWWSPAGLERGQVKGVNRLAFTPSKAQRDLLYKWGVNIVTSFPGEGFVLWGDKTLTQRPSAFDRINVRMLFIVLEKAIAKASRNMLFEFNDEFTRTRFVQMVEPFLRDVQARRGIQRHNGQDGFYVLSDERINTPEVIDANEFRANIYIKPNRSINFITLTFVATRTGVVFEELVEELFPA